MIKAAVILSKQLRDAWHKVSGPDKKPLTLQKNQRSYFRVTDKQVVARINEWFQRRHEAEKEIGAYLRRVSPVLGGETPFYKVDDDGHVESINFRYCMGFTHVGWRGKNHNSNWLIPDDRNDEGAKVRQELKALPPLPSYREINALIGWPEAVINDFFQDMHLPGYEEFAERANRHVNLSRSHGQIYLSVPFPETFVAYPALEKKVALWQPPEFLQPVDSSAGAKIEKRFHFSRTPLGQTVTSALAYLVR